MRSRDTKGEHWLLVLAFSSRQEVLVVCEIGFWYLKARSLSNYNECYISVLRISKPKALQSHGFAAVATWLMFLGMMFSPKNGVIVSREPQRVLKSDSLQHCNGPKSIETIT